jgi:DNA-binding transcriptional ArsR family regulator
MTESAPYDLGRMFEALADPTRRGVVELLRREPRRASDLADAMHMTRPAMSRHLRVLRHSGLVATSHEADARVRVYNLRSEPFDALRMWLHEVDQLWTAQLGAFADYVKKKKR